MSTLLVVGAAIVGTAILVAFVRTVVREHRFEQQLQAEREEWARRRRQRESFSHWPFPPRGGE